MGRDALKAERTAMDLHLVETASIVAPVPLPELVVVPGRHHAWALRPVRHGPPVSVFDVHKQDAHVAGSDASGVVWKVGPGVRNWKAGDEAVLHCNVSCGQCPSCNGGEPMACREQRIWGYETANGSFAQYT